MQHLGTSSSPWHWAEKHAAKLTLLENRATGHRSKGPVHTLRHPSSAQTSSAGCWRWAALASCVAKGTSPDQTSRCTAMPAHTERAPRWCKRSEGVRGDRRAPGEGGFAWTWQPVCLTETAPLRTGGRGGGRPTSEKCLEDSAGLQTR